MSKQAGFVPPSDESIMPSAPPSYEEAMRPQPTQMPMPHLYPSAMPQQMPMPMPQPTSMPMPQPISMPMPQPMPMQQPMATQQSAHHGMHGAQAMQPMSQTHQTTITIPAPIVVTSSPGRDRCLMHCPHCNTSVLTSTTEEHSCLAHLCCCVLFWIGCFLCSCLPYCMASFKMVKHKCPNCGGYLGTYKSV